MAVILISNGQSFLGSHIAESLRGDGHELRLFCPLAAEDAGEAPVSQQAQFEEELATVLFGVDAVIHLAGPAHLRGMELLLNAMTQAEVGKLVLESSLEVYGEGLYADSTGRLIVPEARKPADVEAGRWDLADESGRAYRPLPTPETTEPKPFSAKGVGALVLEEQAAAWAHRYDAQIAVLRLGSVFGPPAPEGPPPNDEIWHMLAAASAGEAIPVAEDGGQVRDWIHVRDVARAFGAAVYRCVRSHGPINIASGRGHSGAAIANMIASAVFNYDLQIAPDMRLDPERPRHLVGTMDLAQSLLGFEQTLPLENSLGEMTMLHRKEAS